MGGKKLNMKKYFSVFAIAARSTIYKIIGILILMATSQIVLFTATLKRMPTSPPLLLEDVIAQSHVHIACAILFIALCTILCFFGYERSGSQLRYTINRLSIKEETTVMIWAAYNIFCFIIFWAVQIIISLVLCRMYLSYIEPIYKGSHTVFLAFYRNKFLHSLLPLEEFSRYIRNIALILGLGFSCTCFSLKQRRGEKSFAFIVLAIMTIVFFSQGIGSFSSDLTLALIGLAICATSIHYIWWGEKNEK